MSALPTNLFEAQRDTLQKDLAFNSYLQGENSLKDNSKIIIPVLNKIHNLIESYDIGLTNFHNKCKERIENINSRMELLKNTSDSINESLKNLDLSFSYYEDTLENLKAQVAEIMLDEEIIKLLGGFNNMKFVQQIILDSKTKDDTSKDIEHKATEFIDFKTQFKSYRYDEKALCYKHIEEDLREIDNGKSIYYTDIYPIEIMVNEDSDSLKIKNNTSLKLIIYIFKNA